MILESPPMLEGGIARMRTCTTMHLCSALPNTFADIAAFSLASVPLTSASFSVLNGDVSGRKCVVAQQNSILPTGNGIVNCVIITDPSSAWTGTTTLPTAIYTTIPVTVASWQKEVRSPTIIQ